MKHLLDTLLFVAVLSALAFCGCEHADVWQREFALDISDPAQSAIEITNHGSKALQITFSLNGRKFFSTLDDVAVRIRSLPRESDNETEVRTVWRFVCSAYYHEQPIAEFAWHHHPVVFFNSLGFGYCSDGAALCYHVWRHMGYEARMWNLTGHVVSEVCRDGRWEMYDADQKVYYHNEHMQVAGVEDLAARPALVTDPVRPVNSPSAFCYSDHIAGLYTSTGDNEYFGEMPESIAIDPGCTLPPGARISFPARYTEPPFITGTVQGDYREVYNYANLRLRVPAGWSGEVRLPLVLQTAAGSGTIRLDESDFAIGSDRLADALRERDSFFYPLHLQAGSDVDLIFFINRYFFSPEESSELILQGSGAEPADGDLLAASVKLDETELLAQP